MVEAVGKHLHIGFSGGLVLATHMRMTGSWHLYRPGERWRKSPSTVRVQLTTADWEAVCFNAPDVRFLDPVASASSVDHLGPDLCRPDADLDACAERFGLLTAGTTLAEVLLDQRVCCGVGNVFKSEVCWAGAIDPFTPVERIDAATRSRAGWHRRSSAPGQPRHEPAHDGAGGPGGLRPNGPLVSTLRDDHRVEGARCPRPPHLLVPGVPALGEPRYRSRSSERSERN